MAEDQKVTEEVTQDLDPAIVVVAEGSEPVEQPETTETFERSPSPIKDLSSKITVIESTTVINESEQNESGIETTPDTLQWANSTIIEAAQEEQQQNQSVEVANLQALVSSTQAHGEIDTNENVQQPQATGQEQAEPVTVENPLNGAEQASTLNEETPLMESLQQPTPSVKVESEVIEEIPNTEDQPMDISTATFDYSNVPPPVSLTSPSSDPFNDAMEKVRAIAAKMLATQQTVATGDNGTTSQSNQSSQSNSNTQQGVKRAHEDSYSSHGSRDSRDDYRDDYRRDSYNRRDRGNRYEDYGRDLKRAAYEGGSSRPEHDNGARHRYGLGSEERRHHSSHYGPGNDSSRSSTQEEFKVPNAVVGLVIGRGGENLKRIEKQTEARIQFSQDQPPDVVERRVTITGVSDDVKSAKTMIQQLVDDATNGNMPTRRDSQSGNRLTITIHIPSVKVGVVIGRGGETIRDLQDRSGARINVTPDCAASPQSNDRPVTLVGDEASVQRAKALIDEIVNTGDSEPNRGHSKDYRSNSYNEGSTYGNDNHGGNYGGSGHYGPGPYSSASSSGGGGSGGGGPGGKSNQDSITIQVPNDSVGLIIGKGGETVRALQHQSGAKIQIEPVHGVPPVERNVQIIGSSDNIAVAKQLILEKAASGNRERPPRHSEQGRGYGSRDYGSVGYQPSTYQQSGYQQGGYQQGGYQQGGYQNSSYQTSTGYQQSASNSSSTSYQPNNGYPNNTYSVQPQQTTFNQSTTTNDYGQTANSVYPTGGTYGASSQQTATNYSQYGQYNSAQTPTTYNQFPAQTQYSTYGQTSQYNQSTGQHVGQSTGQPIMQPASQQVSQPQVGYYQAPQAVVDPTKLGQGTDGKQDGQAVSATPSYGYTQYGYNYGTSSTVATQYPTVVGQQGQSTMVHAPGAYPTAASVYGTTNTTVNPPATAAPGTDQTAAQQAVYTGYYNQQYSQDQYNQHQNYYQQYFQQQQQSAQPSQSYNYQTTANPTEAPKQ